MMDEKGYIKFNCQSIKDKPVDKKLIEQLNVWRNKLYHLKLVGAYPNGIGFGNISIRLDGKNFLITGSATGNHQYLTNKHYTIVTSYNFAENTLTCNGPIQASSESLTHAAVYEANKDINAVIHIHSKSLWNRLLQIIPTTSPTVEYGTPQMAMEIHRLFKETNLNSKKILVMAGHEEGIISFGKDLEEAGNLILSYFH
jgi:L-ribulose-5-phosphate 4-epimerase